MSRVAIVGAGAWGTALAMVGARNGREVMLWAHEAETVSAINERHENATFLPGVALAPEIAATGDLAQAVTGADAVLLVTPAQHLRAVGGALAPVLAPGLAVTLCSKGVEQGTGLLMSEVAAEILPGRPVAVLSGPTLAAEVAAGLPTAVTIACADRAVADSLAGLIGGPLFRPYVSGDVVGAEIGGALKNVLAIACGIIEGRGLGENARAAVITRGLAEMTRLCRAKGGRAETMMGLCGLGDLTLTCASPKSRNYSLGAALGRGETLAGILGSRNSVAEGVFTAAAAVALAGRLGIELPISQAVDAILNRGADIDTAVRELLARPFRAEGIEDE